MSDFECYVLVSAASALKETGVPQVMGGATYFIRGVGAWVRNLALDAVQELTGWARFKKLKGIRPLLENIPPAGWVLWKVLKRILEATRERTGGRQSVLPEPSTVYPQVHRAPPELGGNH